MAEDTMRLVREIERVVTAPYVPSLQDLYELVQRVAPSKVEVWALQKPCQVGLLTDVLMEGLSRSRAALPLLSAFARMTCFRDALLKRHPVVLDAFLEKAMETEPEYINACTDILSSPLPSDIVLPGRVAGFLAKLVASMAGSPCAETVAPLHTLVSTLQASPRLFHEIPDDIMSNLQVEFTKTLRNMDDHMGILLSLATFARIASTQSRSPRYQQGSEPPTWLLNIQHFFGPKRGVKTLDLVVLRVILACSSSSTSLTPAQAEESIRLSISIIDTIGPEQKNAWISAGSSKIAKLCDKIARDGLDRGIQLMGLTFLLSLCPIKNFPPQVRNLGLRLLVSRDSRGALTTMSRDLVIRLTECLSACDESIVYELLRFTVDAVKDNSLNQDSLSSLHVADTLLSSFQANESHQIVSSLLSSASTKETIASLFVKFPVTTDRDQCQGSDVCQCAYSALQNKILLNLFQMYFAATLSQNGSDRDISIMKSFVERAARTMTSQKCSFADAESKNFRSSLLFRDRQEFASKEIPNWDWKSSITGTFMQTSEMAHTNILKKIEDICFDMERRCHDVEGPLRSVEKDRDRCVLEVEELKYQNEELARSLGRSNQTISDLREEMAELEKHAEKAYSRVDELSLSLNSVQQQLHEQQCHSEEIFNVEKERFRTRELDLIATSTEKDDQLEELEAEVQLLRANNENMRQSLEIESQVKLFSSERAGLLERDLEHHITLLEQSRSLCSEKEDEVKRLMADNGNLKMETASMKVTVEEQSREVERLYGSLQEAEEKSISGRETLQQQHEIEISKVATEVANEKREVARLRAAMQEAASDASKKLQSKDKRLQHLERKIQAMRDEREAKAREFSEAQQHIGRLMSVMGFSAQPTEPQSTTKQQTRTSGPSQAAACHSAAYDEDSQLVQSFESTNLQEHSSKRPSPKRPRANRLSLNPSQPPPRTPAAPTTRSATKTPDTAQRSARQPFTESRANSNPDKFQSADLSKHSQPAVGLTNNFEENHLQDFDLDMDLEFSRDFIFTSTAFSGSEEKLAQQ
ncbi:hypothetical protein N7532_001654 [Penicillium argentinense]|uniref:Uncharacterized protein n=1 Tax=Penicillium argentinense TaxID=1131581 RepID=A0A9W9KLG4_9EURO|nr:uncharacterized protein N7532_001654 [Penicillium argentinense]KAJ5111119.1 hypothetical protein N7532_001654 [Penicillium argentinense]